MGQSYEVRYQAMKAQQERERGNSFEAVRERFAVTVWRQYAHAECARKYPVLTADNFLEAMRFMDDTARAALVEVGVIK